MRRKSSGGGMGAASPALSCLMRCVAKPRRASASVGMEGGGGGEDGAEEAGEPDGEAACGVEEESALGSGLHPQMEIAVKRARGRMKVRTVGRMQEAGGGMKENVPRSEPGRSQ